MKRLMYTIAEYLRINAIRRMLRTVDVRRGEITGLILLAVMFALFEGIGLSLLLPILQFAEGGQQAILESSDIVWTSIARFMDVFGLPLSLPVLLVMAFIPILFRQAIFYVNVWYGAAVSSRITVRMRMQALDDILNADPEFFTRYSVGQVVGVVVNQTAVAGQAILAVMKQLSIALLMLLYVAILVLISAPLTLVALVFALTVSFVVRASIVRIREFGLESARVSQTLMGKVVERFSLIRLIKLRDQKTQESQHIRDYSEEMRAISIRQARLGASIEVTADPLLMLSVFITLYVGISVLDMTLAQLGLLLFVLNRLNAKVKEFNTGRQRISRNMAGLILVNEMTQDAIASNSIRRGPVPFSGLKEALVFDDVHFEYPDTETTESTTESSSKAVLNGVSFTVPAGSFTAIVGKSGGGKSTLVELIPRLRDASAGTITFGGVNIKEFDVGSLRKGIGYLTQSAMLFNDTVRNNLVYGLDYEPSEDQIRSALEGAYAAFVYDLPQGLETRLGDRGVRFSGGERQRIGLARVLLEDSSILVLDEPTSALDSESEAYIQEALAKLHGKKTIIVIAHRLATVIEADQLLVIDEGRIVERGTHAELMGDGRVYQKLFESQLL